MQLVLFILGFLLFIGLVLIHEYGHYLAARRSGVEVEEFGLGLPPRAIGKKSRSGMILSLNWLPLGAFVKLKGEHDDDDERGSFGAASFRAKTKIMLAGIAMNLLAGIVILTLLAFVGLPKLINQDTVGQDQFSVKSDEHIVKQQALILYVVPGSPAEQIQIKPRDIITSISSGTQSVNIKTDQDLKDATTKFAGQTVSISLRRGDKELNKNVKLLSETQVEASQKTSSPKPNLGVAPTNLEVARYSWSAPIVALGFTKQLIILTAQGFWHALSGAGSALAGLVTFNHQAREHGQAAASEQVGGPIAIVTAIWNSGTLGLNFLLMFVAVISLSLAFINLLPIPALDGGRLFVIAMARVLRFRLTKSLEETINAVGMGLILLLVVLVTIVDVRRFF